MKGLRLKGSNAPLGVSLATENSPCDVPLLYSACVGHRACTPIIASISIPSVVFTYHKRYKSTFNAKIKKVKKNLPYLTVFQLQ